ncbi:vanin-like protein 1 [Zophobas morio]|uniref:vanin-like protein 1 n=1 Tax=Zophobas morio TaxID=2755281 RepID=UPI0030831485
MKGVSAVLFALFLAIQHKPILAYKAAVLEYYSITGDSPQTTIKKNLEAYSIYADTAKSQSVDILVFPEYGLTTIVSDPTDYAVDLTDSSADSVLTKLSNIASERQIYVVVNLLEKERESNTATKYYNTDLVLDKNGAVILKYRKINLFQEDMLTPGDANQTQTFTTTFGVTFGIFTGYDILFHYPSRNIFKNSDVTDVVYSSAWTSYMPFLTSLSTQQGYTTANGINLLAASYGRPKEGHGGSGIFLPNGKAAELYIADSASTKIIIQEVPKISSRAEKSVCSGITPFGLPGNLNKSNVINYKTYTIFDSSRYNFKNVDMSQRTSTLDVCHSGFCCTFEITLDVSSVVSSDIYKLAAFDGIVKIDDTNHHVRICSLLACENDSNDSCGNRLESTNTKFTKLTAKGNLKREDKTFYVPITVDSFLLPMQQTKFCNNRNETNSTYVELTTLQAQTDVLVFGLLGKTVSAAASVHALGFFVLVAFIIVKSVAI